MFAQYLGVVNRLSAGQFLMRVDENVTVLL